MLPNLFLFFMFLQEYKAKFCLELWRVPFFLYGSSVESFKALRCLVFSYDFPDMGENLAVQNVVKLTLVKFVQPQVAKIIEKIIK